MKISVRFISISFYLFLITGTGLASGDLEGFEALSHHLAKACRLLTGPTVTRNFDCPSGYYVTGVRVLGSSNGATPIVVTKCTSLMVECDESLDTAAPTEVKPTL